MKVTGCSMGCMYAEGGLDKCQCACGGATHGLMVTLKTPQRAHCSPSVRERCQGGQEDGPCKCACGGANHGLYQAIPDFSSVRILAYEPQ